MPITSSGYNGQVDEIVWGARAPHLGAVAGVVGARDYAVTVTGSGVTVAPGTAYGGGVTDVLDMATYVTLERPTTGGRYDVVVLRRNWDTNTTTLTVIPGTTTRAVPPLVDDPGRVSDQALALVQVQAVGNPVIADDLRATHAPTGIARSVAGMRGPLGARYIHEGTNRRYVVGANGPALEWEPPAQVVPPIPVVATGTTNVAFNANGAATITHGLGWRPAVFMVRPRLASTSPGITTALSAQAGPMTDQVAIITAKRMSGDADGWQPYTGSLSYLDWIAVAGHSASAPTPNPNVPEETPTTPVEPPATSGGGTDTVPVDTGAAPAPQIDLPDVPPVWVVAAPQTSSAQAILATAAKEIGTTESPAGSNKVKYWLDELPSGQGQPWCACYTTWVYRRHGIVVTKVLGITNPYYTPTLEAGAKAKGLWYTPPAIPRPGDMVIYGGSANTKAVHVEIVEQWIASTGRVQTIGGNTSDGTGGSPNDGGGVFRNRRLPSSASLPIRGYIRMPTSIPTTLQVKGPFPLPAGHYFGVADTTTTLEHNGVADNAQGVMQIQAEVGVNVDGIFGADTEAAVKRWQAAMFRTQTGTITAADWDVFLGRFAAPAPPTGVVATGGNSSATVTFNASSGAQQYTVVASNGKTATGVKSPMTVTGLTPGIPVTFTVIAANVGGASAPSARSAATYPVEGGLTTTVLGDGTVVPVWAGSSRFGANLITSVVTNIGSQATYDGFVKRFPAARFLTAAQQMARNACVFLYGTGYTPPEGRAKVTFAFSGGDFIAQADTGAGVITMGAKSITTPRVASWMTHEITHLMQRPHPLYGTDKYVTGLVEGVADYVLVRMGYHTIAAQRPPGGGTNWWDGYDTTAFFLDYITNRAATPTPDFVIKLNAQLASSTWTPAQIKSINARGLTVEQLWAEYKAWVPTHAFAAEREDVMTDFFDIEVDDEALIPETGDAATEELVGDWAGADTEDAAEGDDPNTTDTGV